MAAERAGLRSVAPDEKPEPKKPLTVAEAASSGSLKDQLIATRAQVAKAIDSPTCAPRDLAPLVRQLVQIGKELEAIEAAEAEEIEDAAATPDEKWSAI